MKKLASWKTITGTRPTEESNCTITTVTFPFKYVIQRFNVSDVHVELPSTQQKVNVLLRSANGIASGIQEESNRHTS